MAISFLFLGDPIWLIAARTSPSHRDYHAECRRPGSFPRLARMDRALRAPRGISTLVLFAAACQLGRWSFSPLTMRAARAVTVEASRPASAFAAVIVPFRGTYRRLAWRMFTGLSRADRPVRRRARRRPAWGPFSSAGCPYGNPTDRLRWELAERMRTERSLANSNETRFAEIPPC